MESIEDKIIRVTGHKPTECACTACKKQCTIAPCLGTPQDIERLIDAGYGDRIRPTYWAAGILLLATDRIIFMYQAEFIDGKGCVFLKDTLCQLHDKGLKPLEGRLSYHVNKLETHEQNIAWQVAKEWIDPANNEVIERIVHKLNKKNG